MLYYIIHQLPIWTDMENGKRNVRILFIALALYLILHFVAREYENSNILCKFLFGSFLYIVASDMFINAINYKLYYGRSVLKELDKYETDEYDVESHKYIRKENKKKKKQKQKQCQSTADIEPQVKPELEPQPQSKQQSKTKITAKDLEIPASSYINCSKYLHEQSIKFNSNNINNVNKENMPDNEKNKINDKINEKINRIKNVVNTDDNNYNNEEQKENKENKEDSGYEKVELPNNSQDIHSRSRSVSGPEELNESSVSVTESLEDDDSVGTDETNNTDGTEEY